MQGFRSVGVCLVPDGGPHAIQFRSFLALAVMVVRPFSDVPDDEATAALLDKLGGLSPAADMALEYAVAAWWADNHGHTALEWEAVGVRVAVD